MHKSVFLSYRRSDSPSCAHLLAEKLNDLIAPARVFLDVQEVKAGPWPNRLQNAINCASVVLVLIGPKWLRDADEYGRRRIDDPDDWVHKEVIAGLNGPAVVIPVLMRDAKLPPSKALPETLAGLTKQEAIEIRHERLDDDIAELARRFAFDSQEDVKTTFDPWLQLPVVPDIFRLLSWRSRISGLHSREDTFRDLCDWATSDSGTAEIAVLYGVGGSGKTRLAAEVACELGGANWNIRWLDRKFRSLDAEPLTASTLLVLDYPEERDSASIGQLAAAIVDEREFPVRLLLLSRNPIDWWYNTLDAWGAGEIASFGCRLNPLSQIDAHAVFNEAFECVQSHFSTDFNLPKLDFRQWPARLRTPLMVNAAAVHAALTGDSGFRESAQDVIKALVRREKSRLDNMATAVGITPLTGARLCALAAVADGLSTEGCSQILGTDTPSNNVSLLPNWNGGIHAPEPDLVAAALLYQVLISATAPHDPPQWLLFALQDNTSGINDRLARVIDDIGIVYGSDGVHEFHNWLVQTSRIPGAAATFRDAVDDDRAPLAIVPFLEAIAQQLLGDTQSDLERASLLTSIAGHQEQLEQHRQSFSSASEAVDLLRAMVPPPLGNLSRALRALQRALGDLGRYVEEVVVLSELIDVRRQLIAASIGIERQGAERELPNDLNNFAMALATTEIGRLEDAVAALREALDFWRSHEPQTNLDRNSLARILNNLAQYLWRRNKGNDREEARALLDESIEIRTQLFEKDPSRFALSLTLSLDSLFNQGRGTAGDLKKLSDIFLGLARTNPQRFAAKYFNALTRSAVEAQISRERSVERLFHDAVSSEAQRIEKYASSTTPVGALRRLETLVYLSGIDWERANEARNESLATLGRIFDDAWVRKRWPLAMESWSFPDSQEMIDAAAVEVGKRVDKLRNSTADWRLVDALLLRARLSGPQSIERDTALDEAITVTETLIPNMRSEQACSTACAVLSVSGDSSHCSRAGRMVIQWAKDTDLHQVEHEIVQELAGSIVEVTGHWYKETPEGAECAAEDCRVAAEVCDQLGEILSNTRDFGWLYSLGTRLHYANALEKNNQVDAAIAEYERVITAYRHLTETKLKDVSKAKLALCTAIANRVIVMLCENQDSKEKRIDIASEIEPDVNEIVHVLEDLHYKRVIPARGDVLQLHMSAKILLRHLLDIREYKLFDTLIEILNRFQPRLDVQKVVFRNFIRRIEKGIKDPDFLTKMREVLAAYDATVGKDKPENKDDLEQWLVDRSDLEYGWALLGSATADLEMLNKAQAAIFVLLELRAGNPIRTGQLKDSLGVALLARGKATGNREDLQAAIECFEYALEISATDDYDKQIINKRRIDAQESLGARFFRR